MKLLYSLSNHLPILHLEIHIFLIYTTYVLLNIYFIYLFIYLFIYYFIFLVKELHILIQEYDYL